MSQKSLILEHLQKGSSLTTASAVDLFKIYRLSERIRELEKDGFLIQHKREITEAGASIIRYSLMTNAKLLPMWEPVKTDSLLNKDLFPNRTNVQHSDYS